MQEVFLVYVRLNFFLQLINYILYFNSLFWILSLLKDPIYSYLSFLYLKTHLTWMHFDVYFLKFVKIVKN